MICSLLSHQLTATLFCSHLQAGAGWPGVSAVSNGGVVEPAQGVNGTVLANQSSMGTAGYHTHWWTTLALHCGRSRDLYTRPPPHSQTPIKMPGLGRGVCHFFFFSPWPSPPSTCNFPCLRLFEADLAHCGVSSCPTLGLNHTSWYTNVFRHINTHPHKSTSLRPGVRLTYSERTMPFLTQSTINE